jgi:hypothetical protein
VNKKAKIKKEIEIQKSLEGEKCQDEILLKFLDAITTQSQWDSFINVNLQPYGKLSYECHRFYYPTKELLQLMNQ